MNREWKIFAAFLAIFLLAYFIPLATPQFDADTNPAGAKVISAIVEALVMLQWYARNHTLACVVPALFIAGAITTFLSKESVLKHLGPKANKVEAYSVASVSGTVLAVCSCSVLPMFAGIYRVGAGLGPAACFLYAGPAINVLAIFLTARVLGFELGCGPCDRGDGLWRDHRPDHGSDLPPQRGEPHRGHDGHARSAGGQAPAVAERIAAGRDARLSRIQRLVQPRRQARATGRWDEVRGDAAIRNRRRLTICDSRKRCLVTRRPKSCVFAKAEITSIEDVDTWVTRIHHIRWYLAGAMGVLVVLMSLVWLDKPDFMEWMGNTWTFSKLLVPLLFGGVFVVGFLGALVPEKQVAALVGDNSLVSNLIASVVGCLFYFATLTEVPILEALMKNGMARGPALALLLAGPALSLPSILVIRSVVGNTKTAVFVG